LAQRGRSPPLFAGSSTGSLHRQQRRVRGPPSETAATGERGRRPPEQGWLAGRDVGSPAGLRQGNRQRRAERPVPAELLIVCVEAERSLREGREISLTF
jgi:hypothetical protein